MDSLVEHERLFPAEPERHFVGRPQMVLTRSGGSRHASGVTLPILLPAHAVVAQERGVPIVTMFVEVWPDKLVLGLTAASPQLTESEAAEAEDLFGDFWGWSAYDANDDVGTRYGAFGGVGAGFGAIMTARPGPPPGARTLTVTVIATDGARTDLVVDLRLGEHALGSPALADRHPDAPRVVCSGAVLAELADGPAVVGTVVMWPTCTLVGIRRPAASDFEDHDESWVPGSRPIEPDLAVTDGSGNDLKGDEWGMTGTWRHGGGVTFELVGLDPAATELVISLPVDCGIPGSATVVQL